jgi:hypothetical protein
MAEWLYEDGIGERRAALVADGAIIAAEVERDGDGLPVGSVVTARLIAHDRARRRASVRLADGSDVLLTGALTSVTEGAPVRIRLTRMALREAGRSKPALAVPAGEGESEQLGLDLRARIAASGVPVVTVAAMEREDRLEAAGWSELLDSARTGIWPFLGGALHLALTPAMLVIDVDGELAPQALAEAGALAACAAIRALGITGSIGVDFPTIAGRAERQRIDALLEAHLPSPFERTAINGFGFVQIVRRRERLSLIERVQLDPVQSDALALLRRASRVRGTGVLTLTACPPVIALLTAHPDWTAQLAATTGRPVALAADPMMTGNGHAQ